MLRFANPLIEEFWAEIFVESGEFEWTLNYARTAARLRWEMWATSAFTAALAARDFVTCDAIAAEAELQLLDDPPALRCRTRRCYYELLLWGYRFLRDGQRAHR